MQSIHENDADVKTHFTHFAFTVACLTRFCVVLCVCLCTGHFVMVPINLTCPHCLQQLFTFFFFEHLFNLCYTSKPSSTSYPINLKLAKSVAILNCNTSLFWTIRNICFQSLYAGWIRQRFYVLPGRTEQFLEIAQKKPFKLRHPVIYNKRYSCAPWWVSCYQYWYTPAYCCKQY